MAKCQAPDHPDCWHECKEGVCVAFYEIETNLCLTGCKPELLTAGFAAAIGRVGWRCLTTGEVQGLPRSTVHDLAAVLLAMSTQPKTFGAPDKEVVEMCDRIIGAAEQSSSRPRFPRDEPSLREQTIEASWFKSSLAGALKILSSSML